jgi:hypothetical protein
MATCNHCDAPMFPGSPSRCVYHENLHRQMLHNEKLIAEKAEKAQPTRAWHLREILGHLDALVDDLDSHSPTWNEPLAKQNFREMRKLFERCFAEEWAKEGDK